MFSQMQNVCMCVQDVDIKKDYEVGEICINRRLRGMRESNGTQHTKGKRMLLGRKKETDKE